MSHVCKCGCDVFTIVHVNGRKTFKCMQCDSTDSMTTKINVSGHVSSKEEPMAKFNSYRVDHLLTKWAHEFNKRTGELN